MQKHGIILMFSKLLAVDASEDVMIGIVLGLAALHRQWWRPYKSEIFSNWAKATCNQSINQSIIKARLSVLQYFDFFKYWLNPRMLIIVNYHSMITSWVPYVFFPDVIASLFLILITASCMLIVNAIFICKTIKST